MVIPLVNRMKRIVKLGKCTLIKTFYFTHGLYDIMRSLSPDYIVCDTCQSTAVYVVSIG